MIATTFKHLNSPRRLKMARGLSDKLCEILFQAIKPRKNKEKLSVMSEWEVE